MTAADLAALEDRLHRQLQSDTVRFEAILCGCQRRYDWAEPGPPQLRCVIHGKLIIDQDGRILR